MTIPCPHCGKPNRVAGLYRSAELHGKPRGEVACVYCDKRFSAPAAREQAEAYLSNGRKVGP